MSIFLVCKFSPIESVLLEIKIQNGAVSKVDLIFCLNFFFFNIIFNFTEDFHDN